MIGRRRRTDDAQHGDFTSKYATGYEDGFRRGYDLGITHGRFQGWSDAKYRAYRAFADDYEARESLAKYVGEE